MTFILGLHPFALSFPLCFVNAVIIQVFESFDQYGVCFIVIHHKETYASINQHEGEVASEVVIHDLLFYLQRLQNKTH